MSWPSSTPQDEQQKQQTFQLSTESGLLKLEVASCDPKWVRLAKFLRSIDLNELQEKIKIGPMFLAFCLILYYYILLLFRSEHVNIRGKKFNISLEEWKRITHNRQDHRFKNDLYMETVLLHIKVVRAWELKKQCLWENFFIKLTLCLDLLYTMQMAQKKIPMNPMMGNPFLGLFSK